MPLALPAQRQHRGVVYPPAARTHPDGRAAHIVLLGASRHPENRIASQESSTMSGTVDECTLL